MAVDQPPATTPVAAPAQDDSRPLEDAAAPAPPGFGSRGRLRRRARFLRKARELAYRDLGGLVFSLHRFGQRNDELVLAKLSTLSRIDAELRALEASLSERQPVTVLREAGITACPRCAAIHSGEDRFCPGCGLPLSRNVDLPIGAAPAAAPPAITAMQATGAPSPAQASAMPAATAQPATAGSAPPPGALRTTPTGGAPPTAQGPPAEGSEAGWSEAGAPAPAGGPVPTGGSEAAGGPVPNGAPAPAEGSEAARAPVPAAAPAPAPAQPASASGASPPSPVEPATQTHAPVRPAGDAGRSPAPGDARRSPAAPAPGGANSPASAQSDEDDQPTEIIRPPAAGS
jgi:hypothetical protein